MATIISINLHLSKIDKKKIVTGKDGNKYLNLTVYVNDKQDQYGKDVAICHEQTKDERDSKVPRIYCGNGKVLFTGSEKSQHTSVTEAAAAGTVNNNENDDLPF